MKWFLTIKDEFQLHRIEWLFGIPQTCLTRSQNNFYGNDNSVRHWKIGATHISNIDDLVIDYHTPLLKDQGQKSEPLLRIMYTYRKGGLVEAILLLMENLLEACINEESACLLEYLLKAQGPTYTCTRYFDWLEPYIL